MTILPLAAIGSALFGILLSVMAVFLILLVLVQRGRGGGLAGALGGMGGSSAFGAKAGDVFTRITIVAAAIWILLCIAAARWGGSSESLLNISTTPTRGGTPAATADEKPGKKPADPAPATSSEGAGEPASAGGPAAATPPTDAAPASSEPPSGEPATTEAAAPPTGEP